MKTNARIVVRVFVFVCVFQQQIFGNLFRLEEMLLMRWIPVQIRLQKLAN